MSTLAKEDRAFEIIPQDTEVRVRVWGRTVRDLFENALRATAAYLHPEALKANRRGARIEQSIAARAADMPSLLVAFLTQALAETDARGAVFTSAIFHAFGEDFFEADITGVATVGDAAAEIRAVSYTDVEIKKNQDTGLFETTLIFEI